MTISTQNDVFNLWGLYYKAFYNGNQMTRCRKQRYDIKHKYIWHNDTETDVSEQRAILHFIQLFTFLVILSKQRSSIL
jgi:hypothetical protein